MPTSATDRSVAANGTSVSQNRGGCGNAVALFRDGDLNREKRKPAFVFDRRALHYRHDGGELSQVARITESPFNSGAP